MIKCLAIADLFIDREMMEEGLKDLATKGISVDIKEWRHSDLDSLQKDNIKIEKHGCDAVELPEYLLENIEEYQWIITQFAPIGKKSDRTGGKFGISWRTASRYRKCRC
ncbi:hypothetical protein [Enterococcus hirae]|uniref:hypothetical protein n=1 Tax=Enterococcus hirae TaxID=1354 RepID=UPI001F48208D|nr:hypothetical protein [Enterococcus hirae]